MLVSFFVVYWSRDNAVTDRETKYIMKQAFTAISAECPCHFFYNTPTTLVFAVMANFNQPECGPMPNVMAA